MTDDVPFFMQIGAKQNNSIRRLLHQRFAFEQGEFDRGVDHVHASSLTNPDVGWCPREAVYAKQAPTPPHKTQTISASLSYTFEQGRWCESLIRDTLRDLIWGNWQCNFCKKLTEGVMEPKTCTHCDQGIQGMTYVEVALRGPMDLIGSPDLLLKIDGLFTIVELKILSAADFKSLKAPKPEHRLRTQLYVDLLEYGIEQQILPINTPLDFNLSKAFVLYTSRGFGCMDPTLVDDGIHEKFTPWKCYPVARNLNVWSDSMNKLSSRHNALLGGPLPERICDVQACKRAGQCSYTKKCFSDG